MKSKFITLILVVLLSTSYVYCQKNTDWKKDKLTGKVKIKVEKVYRISQGDDSRSKDRMTITKYDSNGNKVYSEFYETFINHLRNSDSKHIKAKYLYDEKGFRDKIIICENVNCDTLLIENDGHGNPIEFVYQNNDLKDGKQRINKYNDRKGRMISQRVYGSNYFPEKLKYDYNDKGNITAKYQYERTDSLIEISRYKYNENSVKIEHQELDGSGNLISKASYDHNGNLLTNSMFKDGELIENHKSEPKYSKENLLIEIKYGFDALNNMMKYEYDDKGNIIKRTFHTKYTQNGLIREDGSFEKRLEEIIEYEYYE